MQKTRFSRRFFSAWSLALSRGRLFAQEQTATAKLIASLMELDTRRLYLAEGCSSLFTYCTSVLHLSEHAAFGRIEVARAARRVPAARHKSKRDIERMVAELRSQPDVPLAPERYRVQLTVSRAAHDHLRRAQDLLRHLIPTGDPAAIVERALAVLVEQLERAKCAATPSPRRSSGGTTTSRHIPAAVRREVWRRDEGRCAFVGARGRCEERGFLEFHHVMPFAAGGPADATNIQLRCRAHNRFEAELFFGADAVRERAPAWDDSARSGPS